MHYATSTFKQLYTVDESQIRNAKEKNSTWKLWN